MTREEAIKLIDTHTVCFYNEIDSPTLQALHLAIEALQGDMYCPNCGVRLVPENEYLEPTQTHGRLIDADALSKKLCETTIFIKDGEVFQRMINDAPTVQADRPHGEWVGLDECSVCGKQAFDFIEGYVDGVEYLPNFCPNCGAKMTKGGDKDD